MGVTIHYQGRLSDPKQLPDLITAIQRSCRTLDWRCINMDEVGKTIERPLPGFRRDRGIRTKGEIIYGTEQENSEEFLQVIEFLTLSTGEN